ncbi:MAG: class I SAM-dependent methyltransferase [Myxococcota bacterium]
MRSVTDLVLAVAGVLRPGAPSLRWSLAQRHALIDHLVRGAPQVLELAAGLSRRGAAMSTDDRVRYVEVDLPPMVARKEALLARSAVGRAVLARPNLIRVGGDARDLDLAALLQPGPAVVVAEGLLVYLEPEAQRALWARVAAALPAGGAIVFDLTPRPEEPPPGWLGRALGWLMGRFTGGRGFVRDARDRARILEELRAAGFAEAEALEPAAVPEAPLPGRDRRTQVVIFRATR